VTQDPSPDYKPKPDVLNPWRGFAVKPAQGSWSLMKAHILENICAGQKGHYDYLMGWLATMFQNPGEPGQVAVVLKGKLGTGKGVLGHAVRQLLGQHAIHINSPKHLIGNFNAHLRDCVFLFADEAFFAGDKAAVGTLKSLITESVLTIEAKFKDVIQCKNRLHVLMASNNEWVVPAAKEERRFFVLDVADSRMQDKPYFKAIAEEMKNGGHEAMLYDLLHLELDGFEVRDVPDTLALQDQKAHSLKTEHAWWRDVLHRGYVFKSKYGMEDYFSEWREWVSTSVLFESYADHAKARNDRYLLSQGDFGKFMADLGIAQQRRNGVIGERLCPNAGMARAELVKSARPHGYWLGTLDEARGKFEQVTKITTDYQRSEPDDGVHDEEAYYG
jgi:hypothetical protein